RADKARRSSELRAAAELSGGGLREARFETSPARSSTASTVDGRSPRQLCNLRHLALGVASAVRFLDDLCRELETTAAANRFAESAIDRRCGTEALAGRGADIAVAMAVADTHVH